MQTCIPEKMRKREAIVLAGGFGTRLAHVVKNVPKPMAPVAGRPFLRYLLDHLAEQRFSRVIIADGYKRETIEEYFGGYYRGMTLTYSPEESPLFTGGAVKQALHLASQEWVYVLNGDTFQDIDFDIFESKVDTSDNSCSCYIACRTTLDASRYGTIEVNRSTQTILRFNEKVPVANGIISSGLYLIRKNALEEMPNCFSLETDYFERVVNRGLLRAVEVESDFIDIGIPEDYERAQSLLSLHCRKWKLALFDRDGTINLDTGHLFEPEKLEIIPSIIPILRDYSSRPDWKIIVITNQAGIAKGLYDEEDMHRLHDVLNSILGERGIKIDAYYYCPHHPDYTGPCECRKPAPGMILKALFDYESEASNCVMFGDKETDRQAADAARVAYHSVC